MSKRSRLEKRRARRERSFGWHEEYKRALQDNPSNNREHGHAGGQARTKRT